MTQLKSNITLLELESLITDVVAGCADDWTYLTTSDKVYISVHEALVSEDKEVVTFSTKLSKYLTKAFKKKVPAGRYENHNEAGYSSFNSLFTAQNGLVRILWLNGKILSVLVGSKPKRIIPSSNKKEKTALKYSPSYFGFSETSDANLSLTCEDKEALMALPVVTWPVSSNESSVVQNNGDSGKSFSVSKNYIRHGSIEKIIGSDDLSFLVYPKPENNLFNQGGSNGSGLPGLLHMISDFTYNDMLEANLLSGDWTRYREYDNTVFMASKDLSAYMQNSSYMRFSFNSLTSFYKSKTEVKKKDIISRKHSILIDADVKKYFDNPKYHVVFSEDKMMYYICKSDKLKATALQTRITKSMREDFISFLNWIGYFSLAADLDSTNMPECFVPVMLNDIKSANWVNKGLTNLIQHKDTLLAEASARYRELYMGEKEEGGTTTLLVNGGWNSLFKLAYGDCGSLNNQYNTLSTDPRSLLSFANDSNLFSFNKKFALDVRPLNVMRTFLSGKQGNRDNNKIYYAKLSDIIPFLTSNFLLSTSVEDAYEACIKQASTHYTKESHMPYWSLATEVTTDSQLLKTCISLSPETLAIFGSVASLSSPTDILSWLELSKDHFVVDLPKRLVAKFPSLTGDGKNLSALIENAIQYYILILSAAEPFSNKLLSPDSADDETGE